MTATVTYVCNRCGREAQAPGVPPWGWGTLSVPQPPPRSAASLELLHLCPVCVEQVLQPARAAAGTHPYDAGPGGRPSTDERRF